MSDGDVKTRCQECATLAQHHKNVPEGVWYTYKCYNCGNEWL